MPNDVEDLFAALAEDAGRARLVPAAAVRRRSDRRMLVQSVTGVAAVVLLVAGLTAGARLVLAGPDRTTPGRPGATQIPDQAFLQRADWPYGVVDGPARMPVIHTDGGSECDRPPVGSRIERQGASMMVYAERSPSRTTAGAVVEKIFVFGGDGAREYLAAFRAAVPTCPVHGVLLRTIAGDLGTGDDSVLIEVTAVAADNGSLSGDFVPRRAYQAVVRWGDKVAVVHVTGDEKRSVPRADAVELARAAAQRLADWER